MFLIQLADIRLRSQKVLLKPLLFLRFNSRRKWLDRQFNDHYTKEAKVQGLRSRAAFKLMELDDKFRLFSRGKGQRVLDLGFAPGAWSQVARRRIGNNGMVLGVDILPCNPPKGVHSIQANIFSRKTHELIRLCFLRHVQLYKMDNVHEHHGYFEHRLEQLDDTTKSAERAESSAIGPEKFLIDTIISDMYECWPQTTGFWNNLTNAAYYRMANTSGISIRDHYQSIDLADAALVMAINLLKPNGNFVCKLYTGREDASFTKRLGKVFQKVYRFKPAASRDESKELYYIGLNKKHSINKVDVFSV